MAAGDLQSASLRLNPEHLGPIDVQVRVDNGVANLTFNAAHAETRQAIEGSRAVLDQMFAQQGLTVGDCAVGDSSRQAGQAAWADSQSRTPGREASNPATRETDAPTPVASIAAVRSTASSGRVDIFA
jgi:flagellar hook-length control protein FliK